MPENLQAALEMLIEIQREQTTHAIKQTVLLERLLELHKAMEAGRDAAVEQVKNHVTEAVGAQLKASELWWRRAFWIAVGLVVLSNIVGAAIDRFIGLLKS